MSKKTESITLKTAIDCFIKHLEIIKRSPETTSTYRDNLNRFYKYLILKYNCQLYVDTITADDFEMYLQEKCRDHSSAYVWNEDKQNYIKKPQEIKEPVKATEQISGANIEIKDDAKDTNIGQFTDILMLLDANKEKLLEMLNIENCKVYKETRKLPRYILPGIASQKTIVMVSTLNQIAKEFCDEYNISQREFFEVAVLEALMKYGYKDEVKVKLRI